MLLPSRIVSICSLSSIHLELTVFVFVFFVAMEFCLIQSCVPVSVWFESCVSLNLFRRCV